MMVLVIRVGPGLVENVNKGLKIAIDVITEANFPAGVIGYNSSLEMSENI